MTGPIMVRKLTILGPVKRVLPARVARYDRKWGLRTSPKFHKKSKTSKRKVYFGRTTTENVDNRYAFTLPPIAGLIKCLQRHLSE